MAIASIKLRMELFVLLTIFSGLLTSIIYTPALTALNNLILAAGTSTESGQIDTEAFSALLSDYLPTLIIGHVALLAVFAALLPFWARAANPNGLLPWDGSRNAYLVRSTRSFFHLVTAALLTLVGLGIIILVASILGLASGGAGGIAMLLIVSIGIWISVILSAAANTAIISSSIDHKIRFTEAITKNRFFLRPIIGSLAFIWFASLMANTTLEPVIKMFFDGTLAVRFVAFLQGSFGFITAAVHISALYKIPGLFRTNTLA